MKPVSFEYFAPTSLSDALALLREWGDDGKILAGGQSLVPLMNMRLARFGALVDITRVPGLVSIRDENGTLVIGATTTQRDVEDSILVAERQPLLAEAIRYVGHPQTRNRGTAGGSVAHADPAAELPTVAVALDGEIEVTGLAGLRLIPARDFFVSYFTAAMEPGEILTGLRLPCWPARTGHAFLEMSRRHGDFAIVGVAAIIGLDEGGAVNRANVVFSGCGETPVRASAVEPLLHGCAPDAAAVSETVRGAVAELQPGDDIHGSAAYRRDVAATLAERAINLALRRAGGIDG